MKITALKTTNNNANQNRNSSKTNKISFGNITKYHHNADELLIKVAQDFNVPFNEFKTLRNKIMRALKEAKAVGENGKAILKEPKEIRIGKGSIVYAPEIGNPDKVKVTEGGYLRGENRPTQQNKIKALEVNKGEASLVHVSGDANINNFGEFYSSTVDGKLVADKNSTLKDINATKAAKGLNGATIEGITTPKLTIEGANVKDVNTEGKPSAKIKMTKGTLTNAKTKKLEISGDSTATGITADTVDVIINKKTQSPTKITHSTIENMNIYGVENLSKDQFKKVNVTGNLTLFKHANPKANLAENGDIRVVRGTSIDGKLILNNFSYD